MKAIRLLRRPGFKFLALFLLGSLGWFGCSRRDETTQPAPLTDQQKDAQRAAEVPETTKLQWTFLNRLRQNDPFDAIDRTMVDDHNQLGVELDASVTAGKVPALMKKVMAKMAEEFPHQDLTVSAFAPGYPPRKFGTVHLDGKTGQAIYTPAQ